MALTVNTNIINDTDQYLLDAKNVKGGYVVVNSTTERDALPTATTVAGTLCYCTSDSKFYQYNGTSWVEQITKATVGLSNVDNTSDATKKSNFTGSIAANNSGFVTGGVIYSALEDKMDSNGWSTGGSGHLYYNNISSGGAITTTSYGSGSISSLERGGAVSRDTMLMFPYGKGYIALTDHDDGTHTHAIASSAADGLMSAADKAKLDGITIPTVNNGTLTIQKNGTTIKTFTANSSSNVTANITVPTKVSELTNDSGFKTVDTNTTYDLAATKSSANGNVKLNLTAGGSGSGTDSVTIKGSGTTSVTTDSNGVIEIKSSDHPTALKNPNALTIGGKSYDGSSAVSVSASDLGIANALHFIGETTTTLTDGATTTPVTIGTESITPVSGDVVLYNSKEFIWNGSAWKELGDGASHALKTITITAGNGLTGGGDISTNRTLNVGAGNGITVSADAVAAKAGSGITVDSTGINHADTSSQASVTASGRKYITGVTLDTYGHVTGLTTGTESVTDTNQTVKVGTTTFGASDTVEFVAGSNITLTPDATNDKITIAATDTVYNHPTYTARNGKPTSNQTPAFGGTATVSQITSDTTGHVTNMTDRTIKIPDTLSNGTSTAGLIKTSSTVTSNSGYTACPVISGVPYYKDTNTVYTHPTPTKQNKSSLVKIAVDSTGHVTDTVAVTKSDITALGIPGQDTKYGVASSTTDGLMSKADKAILDALVAALGVTYDAATNTVTFS